MKKWKILWLTLVLSVMTVTTAYGQYTVSEKHFDITCGEFMQQWRIKSEDKGIPSPIRSEKGYISIVNPYISVGIQCEDEEDFINSASIIMTGRAGLSEEAFSGYKKQFDLLCAYLTSDFASEIPFDIVISDNIELSNSTESRKNSFISHGMKFTYDVGEDTLIYTISAFEDTNENEEDAKIYLNGKQLFFDTAPKMCAGRIMVPAGEMVDKLDGSYTWYDGSRQVEIKKGEASMVFRLDYDKASLSGEGIDLGVNTYSVKGRLMVPVRTLCEGAGADVFWSEKDNAVIIHMPQ